ncbi:MAG: C25 family cysteine peptidase, partial [bacterium]|nr:C25 family cysteine peptidase [bacterium]
ARARDVTDQFTMRLRFLGSQDSEEDDALRQVRVELQNSRGTNELATPVIPNKTVRTITISSIDANLLDEDVNTLVLRAMMGRPRLKVLLNWFEIDYPSLYRASGDVLDFHTGAQTGSVDMTVIGLGRTDLMLFDVTDPLDVRECALTPGHFTSVTGGYALAFNETVASQKRYILTPREKITQVGGLDVVAVNPGGLVGHPLEAGVDVLVVSHADYLDEMQRWVTYRKAQGYRVLMADVEDVFNEFNGGNNHARAIKNFARHFFETGGASFLFLVGDASEDNKKVHVESMPNFVPTESYSEFIAGGFDVDEVVTSDKWYTMLDTDMDEFIQRLPPPPWQWFLPDLFVGRLPAGNVGELRVMLDKIFLFETPRGDDFWRRRMIRTADDAWSDCPGFRLRNNGEIAFELAEEAAATITEESMPGGYDVVRFFLSNRFVHEPGGCITASIHTFRCRENATPALLAELNRGATFASFQNHMNRYLMCHEWLLTSSSASPTGFGQDHRRFDNVGRPWIAFGMGCHMSDYALHKERSGINVIRNDGNGDAMAELMLFRENAGAVTTYGSTGFEYLAENRRYTTVINEEIFNNTPTSPMLSNGRRQARWIFGELMMQSEIENLNRYGYSSLSGNGAVGQAIRYHILGDPMLQIDAGPPRFDVTVDGVPFQSGDFLFGDSVNVVGTVVDEVAIERLELTIDSIDRTSDMTVTALVDSGLDASRRYEFRFSQIVEPRTYDIVITASQSPDTNGTDYHTVAEFTMKVELGASLTVNGRPIGSGELVPAKADYVFDVTSPVPLGPSDFEVFVDTVMVTEFTTVVVKPDSTQWLVKFPLDLAAGKHAVTVTAAGSPFVFQVIVSIQVGLSQVIAYPNPFVDETYIVYTNDVEITDGTIDIFTLSGRRVAELPIPSTSRLPGQNAVLWNGRTYNGDPVANGVYFFVINISQAGTSSKHRGKMMRGR